MAPRLPSRVFAVFVVMALAHRVTVAQTDVTMLFYDPVGTPGSEPVGVHYWFENDAGGKFSEAKAAGAGARVRMHLRSNASGYLTVWMADGSSEGRQLTPMQSRFHGYLLDAHREYVVAGDFTVETADSATRVLVLFARSQTEQVANAIQARDKIQRLSTERAIGDGLPSIVHGVDESTPGQIGSYTVHRKGGQAGLAIAGLARAD